MKSGVYYSTYPVLACSRHLEQRVIIMFTHDAVSQVRPVAMVILKLWERGFPCVLCFVYHTRALCESVCWSWTVEIRSCKDVKSRLHLQDTEVEAVCVPVPALCEHSQTLIWILNHLQGKGPLDNLLPAPPPDVTLHSTQDDTLTLRVDGVRCSTTNLVGLSHVRSRQVNKKHRENVTVIVTDMKLWKQTTPSTVMELIFPLLSYPSFMCKSLKPVTDTKSLTQKENEVALLLALRLWPSQTEETKPSFWTRQKSWNN